MKKKHHEISSILLLAVSVGFLAGIFYSHSGVTGLVIEESIPPIVDINAADAFFIKESEYKAIVGTRPLEEVKPEEFTPYRATEARLLEKLYILVVVKNKGAESIKERLFETSSVYTTCDIVGIVSTIKDRVPFNRQNYITWNCADLAPGESRVMNAGFIDEVTSAGRFCLDIAVDIQDTVSEWEEGNNARHNIGCMTVTPEGRR